MLKPWPYPPADGTTFWHVTDAHVNVTGVPIWTLPRLNAIADDLNETATLGNVSARVLTGDITEHGKADQTVPANDWILNNLSAPEDVLVYGNHDFGNTWEGYAKDLAAVEADYGGRPGNTDTYAGPPDRRIRFLGIAPASLPPNTGWVIPQETIDWLEARLNEDFTTPTFICCHYSQGQTKPVSTFNDLISAHPNIVAWVCGHAHWPVTSERSITTKTIGNRVAFPQFSGPSTGHTNGSGGYQFDAQYPYCSFFITYRDTNRIEIRRRNHGARQWVPGYGGELVTVLNPSL